MKEYKLKIESNLKDDEEATAFVDLRGYRLLEEGRENVSKYTRHETLQLAGKIIKGQREKCTPLEIIVRLNKEE